MCKHYPCYTVTDEHRRCPLYLFYSAPVVYLAVSQCTEKGRLTDDNGPLALTVLYSRLLS